MTEPIHRRLDGWDITATQRHDRTWVVEAVETLWARSVAAVGKDLEQALIDLAPKIQLDSHELKHSFGL